MLIMNALYGWLQFIFNLLCIGHSNSQNFLSYAKGERIFEEILFLFAEGDNILRGRSIYFNANCIMLILCHLLFVIYSFIQVSSYLRVRTCPTCVLFCCSLSNPLLYILICLCCCVYELHLYLIICLCKKQINIDYNKDRLIFKKLCSPPRNKGCAIWAIKL